MGSKRFKNLDCAYCVRRKSVTGDHIFAREFFLPRDRDRLPQAPTCEYCNNEKSKLEHYLTTVLPFAGRHNQSLENLTELTPKRLNKNHSLQRELQEGKVDVNVSGNEVASKTTGLPVREGTIEALFNYIARGLSWHHWGVYMNPDNEIESLALTAYGEKFFQDNFFSLRPGKRVLANIGNGTVIYEGVQGVDSPQISIWRFRFYGGITLVEAGSPHASTEIGVISGPPDVQIAPN